MKASIRSIGRIRTPYRTLDECPRNINPEGPDCELDIDEEFAEGLAGLTPGQHILVLYWFEDVDRRQLMHRRRSSDSELGVFALRSPVRPNPIAAAVVRIESIEAGRLRVRGLDCLDGTPLLDIKPAIFAETPDGSGKQYAG